MKALSGILASLLLLATMGFAQQGTMGSAPRGMGGPHGRPGPPSVDEHVKLLDEELTLTADQKTKIRSILEGQRTEMQKMRDDTSTPRDQKWTRMKQEREATHGKIRAVLTTEQQKKFDAMQKRMEEMHRGMGGPGGPQGAGDAGGPPTPPRQ